MRLRRIVVSDSASNPWSMYASEDGGGDPSLAFGLQASLQIWAKSSNGASLPRIVCVTAREYAGDR